MAAGAAVSDGRVAARRAVLLEAEAATEDAAASERVRAVRAVNIVTALGEVEDNSVIVIKGGNCRRKCESV